MSVYGITGVKIDGNGNVAQATLGKLSNLTKALSHVRLEDAADIASKIICGDEVYGVFNIDGNTVLGPKFSNVVLAGGRESITLDEDERGLKLTDLVQICGNG